MRRHTKYALAFALGLALITGLVGTGWAAPNPYVSSVFRNAPMAYSNQLTATVTEIEGGWHYEYSLVYAASANNAKLTSFSVANIYNLPFTNQGSSHSFQNGVSSTSVLWNSGNVSVGNTVRFWFDSVYDYKVVSVTLSGGLPSNGLTLGMVPEPAGLAVMALGFMGFVPFARRKR